MIPLNLTEKTIAQAESYLSEADPVLKVVIDRFAPCTLKPDRIQSPFEALARAIASQQLHGAAATAILKRFTSLVPGKSFPEPDDIACLTDEQIRATGFSYSKIRTLPHLSFGSVPNNVVCLFYLNFVRP